MQHNRNIRISIKEHIKAALESPGVGGMSAFNVYGENNLPQRNPSFEPERPYIFLVDSLIEPTRSDLPMIVIEVNPFLLQSTEIGRKARTAELNLHIFGRNRGERDDLASYLQDWLGTSGSGNVIDVLDYNRDAGLAQLDRGEVQEPVRVWSVMTIPEYIREEASMANLNIVSCEVRFKQR